MHEQTLKQEALESLQRLPDNLDIDEIMYQLYVIDKLTAQESRGHQAKRSDQP